MVRSTLCLAIAVIVTAPVSAQNLLDNPGFDVPDQLTGWTCTTTSGVASWSTEDRMGSPTSGSMQHDVSADVDDQWLRCSQCVPVGGFIVFGIEGNPSLNGGATVDYVYSGILPANTSDELVLNNDTGGLVDLVAWDDGVSFPDPNGASMALANPALDNSLGDNWCLSVSPFGAGDLGTPGVLNEPCP